MAVTYNFLCTDCKYEDDIYIGNTKMQFIRKLPEHTLGSCLDCGKLFSNAKRHCKYCSKPEPSFPNINIFKRIKNWLFDKSTAPIEVRFYREDNVKQIPCPKCNHKSLISHPVLFSD